MGVPCYEIKEGVAWDNIPFTDELRKRLENTTYTHIRRNVTGYGVGMHLSLIHI